jgi:hypothetical protein
MLDRLRAAIRRKGVLDGLRWLAWDTVRGTYRPLAYGLPRHLPGAFIDKEELERRSRRTDDLHYFGTEESFVIEAPEGDDPADVADVDGEYVLHRPFLGVLEDASLVGPYPLAVADRRVVLDATISPEVTLLNVLYGGIDAVSTRLNGSQWEDRARFESAILLFNCWNSGYFHWVTETLTRLEAVEAYRELTGEQPTLIVGPDFGGFQRETLELLGYGPDDWVEWSYWRASVDRLVVPSSPRHETHGEIAPATVEWLRDEMRNRVSGRVDPEQFSRLVYVSRNDADRRRVSNEDALMEALEPLGFERYHLAHMSSEETITLMMQADMIVGTHGAGLTDILFADDATVVEFCQGDKPNTRAYRVLASQADLRHQYVPCRVDGPDLRVDVPTVRSLVEQELDTIAEVDA